MVIILGKHDGYQKEYVWSVPPWMDIRKGDVMLVDTMNGLDVATATSELIECADAEDLAKRFGAYLPLKEVKGYCGQLLRDYLRNQTLHEVGNAVFQMRRNIKEIFIPF